jgi:hypothetical protein
MKLYKLPHDDDDDDEVTTTFCLYYKLHNHTRTLFVLCSTAVEMMVLIHQVGVNTEMIYLCQVARVSFPATFLLVHSHSSFLFKRYWRKH